MKVYVVNLRASSPNYQTESEEDGDYRVEITYKYDKKTRKKIAAVRTSAKKKFYDLTTDFHGIRLAKDEVIAELEKIASKADNEMSEIDESLYAGLVMAPIDMDEVRTGELYQIVLNAIRYNIYRKVFDRVTEIIQKNKTITDATRGSLYRLFDQLKNLNVLNDIGIDTQIANLRAQVEATKLEDIVKDLQREIDAMETRGGRIAVRKARKAIEPTGRPAEPLAPARVINVTPVASGPTAIPEKIDPERGTRIIPKETVTEA